MAHNISEIAGKTMRAVVRDGDDAIRFEADTGAREGRSLHDRRRRAGMLGQLISRWTRGHA